MMVGVSRESSSTPVGWIALRPSWSAFARAGAAGLVVLGPLAVVAASRVHDWPALLPIALAAAAVLAVVGALAWRNVRVELRDGEYRRVSLLGTTRRFRAEDVVVAILAHRFVPAGATAAPHLVVAGSEGPPLLRLGGTRWPHDAVLRMADDLEHRGVLVDHVHESYTHDDLRRRHPRLVNRWEAHPFLVGLGAAAVIIGGLVAAVLWSDAAGL
jgi:hypothetical protein